MIDEILEQIVIEKIAKDFSRNPFNFSVEVFSDDSGMFHSRIINFATGEEIFLDHREISIFKQMVDTFSQQTEREIVFKYIG